MANLTQLTASLQLLVPLLYSGVCTAGEPDFSRMDLGVFFRFCVGFFLRGGGGLFFFLVCFFFKGWLWFWWGFYLIFLVLRGKGCDKFFCCFAVVVLGCGFVGGIFWLVSWRF